MPFSKLPGSKRLKPKTGTEWEGFAVTYNFPWGEGEEYVGYTSIMEQATGTPFLLETVFYSKSTQFPCQGVLYHGTEKGTHKKKKRGGISRDTKSLYYAKKAHPRVFSPAFRKFTLKQPWLLVDHLPEKYSSAKKVVKLYRFRMQIEEGFRDTKNQQYGLGLAQAKSKSAARYDNLLLIAALTLFLLWCMGESGHRQPASSSTTGKYGT